MLLFTIYTQFLIVPTQFYNFITLKLCSTTELMPALVETLVGETPRRIMAWSVPDCGQDIAESAANKVIMIGNKRVRGRGEKKEKNKF
jgi:hypothetical protein